jgi:hypothetical protein
MNSRDQALAPVQFSERNDDAITFWDVIMPWKRMTNSKAYNTIGQTTDSTPASSNYIDLTPLARPSKDSHEHGQEGSLSRKPFLFCSLRSVVIPVTGS